MFTNPQRTSYGSVGRVKDVPCIILNVAKFDEVFKSAIQKFEKKIRFNKHQKWNVYIANNPFFKIHC
jgi:hypothetical protein